MVDLLDLEPPMMNTVSYVGRKSEMSLRTGMVVRKWACSISRSGWWMGTIGGWKKGEGMGMRVGGGGVGVEV